jgi:hypothetical protein
MLDYVGQSQLTIGDNAYLATDRLNNAQSALYLNTGYCTVPPGEYFTGGSFTIIAWVYRVQISSQNRLLDFGNGPASDNVIFGITDYTTGEAMVCIYQGSNSQVYPKASINSGEWIHLAAVFGGNNLKIYVNGVIAQSIYYLPPNKVVRQLCYFGRSSWHLVGQDQDTHAYFDDIKIYNRTLSPSELQADMN